MVVVSGLAEVVGADLLAGSGLINNALLIRDAAARRRDALPVNSLMHGNQIAGLRDFRCALDCAERRRSRTRVAILAICGDMNLRRAERDGQHKHNSEQDNFESRHFFAPSASPR